MEKRFNHLMFEKTFNIQKEGMRIYGYIAGVNSGQYSLPFVISVQTWAKKWWFRKFFTMETKLNIMEMKQLRRELDTAIEYFEEKQRQEEKK